MTAGRGGASGQVGWSVQRPQRQFRWSSTQPRSAVAAADPRCQPAWPSHPLWPCSGHGLPAKRFVFAPAPTVPTGWPAAPGGGRWPGQAGTDRTGGRLLAACTDVHGSCGPVRVTGQAGHFGSWGRLWQRIVRDPGFALVACRPLVRRLCPVRSVRRGDIAVRPAGPARARRTPRSAGTLRGLPGRITVCGLDGSRDHPISPGPALVSRSRRSRWCSRSAYLILVASWCQTAAHDGPNVRLRTVTRDLGSSSSSRRAEGCAGVVPGPVPRRLHDPRRTVSCPIRRVAGPSGGRRAGRQHRCWWRTAGATSGTGWVRRSGVAGSGRGAALFPRGDQTSPVPEPHQDNTRVGEATGAARSSVKSAPNDFSSSPGRRWRRRRMRITPDDPALWCRPNRQAGLIRLLTSVARCRPTVAALGGRRGRPARRAAAVIIEPGRSDDERCAHRSRWRNGQAWTHPTVPEALSLRARRCGTHRRLCGYGDDRAWDPMLTIASAAQTAAGAARSDLARA
jgi:hypothetical protein